MSLHPRCALVVLVVVGLLAACQPGPAQRADVSDRGRPETLAPSTTSPPSARPWRSLDDRLALLTTDHYEDSGYRHVAGVVKNISGTQVADLTVMVAWYTDWKDFVTTRETPVDVTPLAPGQSSSFNVRGPANPYASRFSVQFNDANGDEIPTGTILD